MPPHSLITTTATAVEEMLTAEQVEDLEARRWAFDTIKLLLTDTVPVSFKSDFDDLQPFVISPIKQGRKKKQRKNSLRRSFSFFEGSLFGPSSANKASNSRRSQSTIVTGHIPTLTVQSEPCSPAKLSPILPSTFTQHTEQLPDHHCNNESNVKKHIFHSSDLLHSEHKTPSKVKKGIRIWKDTYAQYMVDPPPSLEIKASDHLKKIEKQSDLLLKFIATELVTTEKTYLSHLTTIKDVYMNPLLEASSTNPKLVNQKDVETIFAFVPQLISISSAMLTRLDETISQETVHKFCIGKIFCHFENHFDVYIAYAANFSRSRKCLEKSSSNIVYRQLVQDSMSKRTTNRMLLSDYMIAPIQRIMRYCLLLKDLKKHSSPFKPDFIYLEKAIACMASLAVAMDSVQ